MTIGICTCVCLYFHPSLHPWKCSPSRRVSSFLMKCINSAPHPALSLAKTQTQVALYLFSKFIDHLFTRFFLFFSPHRVSTLKTLKQLKRKKKLFFQPRKTLKLKNACPLHNLPNDIIDGGTQLISFLFLWSLYKQQI